MHPELIRAEIKMRGKTLTDVARLYDVTPKVVSLALYKPSLSGEKRHTPARPAAEHPPHCRRNARFHRRPRRHGL